MDKKDIRKKLRQKTNEELCQIWNEIFKEDFDVGDLEILPNRKVKIFITETLSDGEFTQSRRELIYNLCCELECREKDDIYEFVELMKRLDKLL